jgi:hypothetical protein
MLDSETAVSAFVYHTPHKVADFEITSDNYIRLPGPGCLYPIRITNECHHPKEAARYPADPKDQPLSLVIQSFYDYITIFTSLRLGTGSDASTNVRRILQKWNWFRIIFLKCTTETYEYTKFALDVVLHLCLAEDLKYKRMIKVIDYALTGEFGKTVIAVDADILGVGQAVDVTGLNLREMHWANELCRWAHTRWLQLN